MKLHFRPEFLNRIDEIITFNALDKKTIYEILDKLIENLNDRVKNSHIKIELSKKAKDYLVDKGFDYNYGARPLKRVVSKNLETLLAKSIIEGKIITGDNILVDVKDDNLILNKI